MNEKQHIGPEVARILLTAEEIQRRVLELGAQITADYTGKQPMLVGVLTGAFVFMADLARAIELPLDIEFMAVSSYGLATKTSGVVRILKDLDSPVEGRDVIVVEDIIDSGLTLEYLLDILTRRNPNSLRVAALFDKPKPGRQVIDIHYVGFEIPDVFVVGYGLDAAKLYRNLPYLGEIQTNRDAEGAG